MIASPRLLALGAALLWSAAALAAGLTDDADAPGHGSGLSFAPMRGGIAVRPLDNSKLNHDVAERITDTLRKRGIAVADDAPLLLEFETAIDSAAPRGKRGTAEPPRDIDNSRNRDPGGRGSDDTGLNFFSNQRSSVLTGVRPLDRGMYYTLRATLSDRNGPRIWEGYTEYMELVNDETRVFGTMAPLLANMVGTNAEGRFRVD